MHDSQSLTNERIPDPIQWPAMFGKSENCLQQSHINNGDKIQASKSNSLAPMIGENWQLLTDELVEFEK